MLVAFRHEHPLDYAAIRGVHRLAFGGPAEGKLVDALRASGHARLSVVAEVEDQIVGHIFFSQLQIHLPSGEIRAALALAPMAIVPARQRHGVGSAMLESALDDCRAAGHGAVLVLGDTLFYPRFGFTTELAQGLESPYAGPHLMGLELQPGTLAGLRGRVEYPPAFAEL